MTVPLTRTHACHTHSERFEIHAHRNRNLDRLDQGTELLASRNRASCHADTRRVFSLTNVMNNSLRLI